MFLDILKKIAAMDSVFFSIDKSLCLSNNVAMIHNRIAVFRADMGLSRQELASMVGVNYQTIGFIERGDYSPSLELAFKLAKVFGVSVTDIFSDQPFRALSRIIEEKK